MTDMNDQSAQEPRSGATAGRTTAAAQDAAARTDTAATADTARGYVPRPAPGYDDVNATYREPRGQSEEFVPFCGIKQAVLTK